MIARCRCGRIGSTRRACKVCGSERPMLHHHGDETQPHAHPHEGDHDHCPHPEALRQPTILNPDQADLAYCGACACVIRLVNGQWLEDSVPGQITKVVARRA